MELSIILQAAAGLGAIAPWLAVGGAALQIGTGISQLVKAKKMRGIQRPVMTTPQAMLEYYRRRQFEAGKYGLPGQGQTEAKMARQTAATQRAIQQSGQTSAEQMAALAGVDQATKEQVAGLGVQAAQFKEQQTRAFDQAQKEMAAQKLREWQYNVAEPFARQELAQAALYQGGMTNLSDFATNMSKLFANWKPNETT